MVEKELAAVEAYHKAYALEPYSGRNLYKSEHTPSPWSGRWARYMNTEVAQVSCFAQNGQRLGDHAWHEEPEPGGP